MALTKSREESLRNMVRGVRTMLEANGKDHNNSDVVFQSVVNAQKFGLGMQVGKEDKDFLKVCIPEIIAGTATTPVTPQVVSPEGGATTDSQKIGGESITPVGVGGEPLKEAVEPEVIEEVSWKDTYNFDKESGEFRLNISKLGGNIKKLVDDPNQLKRAAAVGSSKAAQAGISSWLTAGMTKEEKENPRARVIERGVCDLVDNFISQLFK